MDMEQSQDQPVEASAAAPAMQFSAEATPVLVHAAPDMSVEVKGYYAAQPVGALVRKIAEAAGLALGNVPAADAEPIISFVRWDDAASAALDGLARVVSAKWEVSDGTLHFVLGTWETKDGVLTFTPA